MTKIVKALSTEKETPGIEARLLNGGYGLVTQVSWERLKPYLEQAVNLDKNEKLVGIIADENGIKVILDYKK
jgi:hypothetical protein